MGDVKDKKGKMNSDDISHMVEEYKGNAPELLSDIIEDTLSELSELPESNAAALNHKTNQLALIFAACNEGNKGITMSDFEFPSVALKEKVFQKTTTVMQFREFDIDLGV